MSILQPENYIEQILQSENYILKRKVSLTSVQAWSLIYNGKQPKSNLAQVLITKLGSWLGCIDRFYLESALPCMQQRTLTEWAQYG